MTLAFVRAADKERGTGAAAPDPERRVAHQHQALLRVPHAGGGVQGNGHFGQGGHREQHSTDGASPPPYEHSP